MEPWVSWTAFLTAAGGLAWYYTKDIRTAGTRREQIQPQAVSDVLSQPSSRKRDKGNKSQPQKSIGRDVASTTSAEATASDSQSKKKRKATKQTTSQPQSSAPIPTVPDAAEDDDPAVDDKEWAAQLAAAKQGVSLEKKAGSDKRNKAVPVNASQNVSDMLPEPAAGPSSIRITGGDEAQHKKQQAKQSKQEDKRTKKQRQNDRKKEEARIAREADEEQRQKLLEQQRRSAREARGEPAKNGLAQAPSSNAWNSANGGNLAAVTPAGPLLDTFEQDANSSASDSNVITSANAPVTNSSTYDQDGYMLSAEAKQEIENASWEEVGRPKKTKKTKVTPTVSPPPETSGNINGSITSPPVAAPNGFITQPAVQKSAPVKPQSKSRASATNPFAVLNSAQTYFKGQPHEGDSDWSVA